MDVVSDIAEAPAIWDWLIENLGRPRIVEGREFVLELYRRTQGTSYELGHAGIPNDLHVVAIARNPHLPYPPERTS